MEGPRDFSEPGAANFSDALVDAGLTAEDTACPADDERNDCGYCLLVVNGEDLETFPFE